MPKAPEWLNADIQEFYPPCQGHIRAIQRAILEKRGVGIAYMTISDRLQRLGLERPSDKKKAKVNQSQTQVGSMPKDVVEVLPGQRRFDTTDTGPPASEGKPVSAVADIVPMNTDIVPLSTAEVQTLAHYEQIIERGIKTFVEVGHALLVIRDERLYREGYTTFEDYCRQRWDLSRPYAYQLMEASVVVENVSAVADIVPANEAQARPLTTLPAEQQREVWREAVETAPASGITAKHVQATIKRAQAKPTGPLMPKSRAEETRERMGERGQPNGSWINVLSHAHRLCSSLRRMPDLDEVLESWGPEGRQKAVSYLRPLSEDTQQLLWSLNAIDTKPFSEQSTTE
jgi:hypothetical protein